MELLKKIIPISFALLILLQSFSKVWVFISFKINQEYIAKTFCVNRNTPESVMCSGRCYLKEQIEQSLENERLEFSFSSAFKFETSYYTLQTNSFGSNQIGDASFPPIFSSLYFLVGQSVIQDIFHPPQFQSTFFFS